MHLEERYRIAVIQATAMIGFNPFSMLSFSELAKAPPDVVAALNTCNELMAKAHKDLYEMLESDNGISKEVLEQLARAYTDGKGALFGAEAPF